MDTNCSHLNTCLPCFCTGYICRLIGCKWGSWLHYLATFCICGIYFLFNSAEYSSKIYKPAPPTHLTPIWTNLGIYLVTIFGRWQIWALQLQKHKGGTSISLRTIHANAVLVFHISTSCVVILHRLQKTWMLQMLSHDHTM